MDTDLLNNQNSGYISGKLSKKERNQFESHLAKCNLCRDVAICTDQFVKAYPEEVNSYSIPKNRIFQILERIKPVEKLYEWFNAELFLNNPFLLESAAVRSVDSETTLVHQPKVSMLCLEVIDIKIKIYIKKSEHQLAEIAVKNFSKARNIRVTLERKDGDVHSMLLKDDDKDDDKDDHKDDQDFIEIPFAKYRFSAEQFGKEKGVLIFRITEQGVVLE